MCGRLVNLDTVARVLADYYHLKTDTQLAALDEALSRVPAETVGGGHGKDHVADPTKMVGDLISRQAAIDAMMKLQTEDIEAYGASIPEGFDGDRAVTALKALPSAQQWISCEERLPEAYVDVLVWFEYYRYGDYNCLYQMHGIGTYIKEYDSWIINHETGWGKLRVFAWMPLPEPWKGEKP